MSEWIDKLLDLLESSRSLRTPASSLTLMRAALDRREVRVSVVGLLCSTSVTVSRDDLAYWMLREAHEQPHSPDDSVEAWLMQLRHGMSQQDKFSEQESVDYRGSNVTPSLRDTLIEYEQRTLFADPLDRSASDFLIGSLLSADSSDLVNYLDNALGLATDWKQRASQMLVDDQIGFMARVRAVAERMSEIPAVSEALAALDSAVRSGRRNSVSAILADPELQRHAEELVDEE